jgi:hypothetical protein
MCRGRRLCRWYRVIGPDAMLPEIHPHNFVTLDVTTPRYTNGTIIYETNEGQSDHRCSHPLSTGAYIYCKPTAADYQPLD